MSTPGEQIQAPSVRIPKRFPLVSKPGFRSTTFTLADPTVRSPVSDAAMINAYAELDPEDNLYWVEKRLGTITLTTSAGAAGGVGIGYGSTGVPVSLPVAIFGPNMYVWTGTTLSQVFYTGTHARPLVNGRLARFLQIPGTSANLLWAANNSLWMAVLSPGHLPAPSYGYSNAVDFITAVPWTVNLVDGVAYLDDVTYVMDVSGNIWGSNPDDVTTWPATTLIKAGGRADIPVCLAQQLEYVIAFKSTSYRCFYDAGSAAQTSGVGSNLAWVEGADGNFGCANAGSVQLIDNTLIWVTNNDKNTAQIARMDGLQMQIISTPPIERLLQTITMGAFSADPNAINHILYSAGIKRGGHRFYVLTVPPGAANKQPFTLVYDLDQQLWYPWTSNGLSYWSVTGVSAQADTLSSGLTTPLGAFAQDISSGALYLTDIDQVYPTDSGLPCQVDIYTPNTDMGTRRNKQVNAMYFMNDQVSGSVMYVRKSDNDYRSWSPLRKVKLSSENPSLTRCGTFKRRALNLRHNAATPFRIKATDVQVDIGSR